MRNLGIAVIVLTLVLVGCASTGSSEKDLLQEQLSRLQSELQQLQQTRVTPNVSLLADRALEKEEYTFPCQRSRYFDDKEKEDTWWERTLSTYDRSYRYEISMSNHGVEVFIFDRMSGALLYTVEDGNFDSAADLTSENPHILQEHYARALKRLEWCVS